MAEERDKDDVACYVPSRRALKSTSKLTPPPTGRSIPSGPRS